MVDEEQTEPDEDAGKMVMSAAPAAAEDDEEATAPGPPLEGGGVGMRVLTAADIMDADLPVITSLDVPALGGRVLLRGWGGKTRDAYEEICSGRMKGGKLDAHKIKEWLIVKTVCDEEGKLLFNEGHIDALNAKAGAGQIIDFIATAVARENGIGVESEEELLGN